MSNIKISEMAEAESLNDNDLLTIVQSGVNKKITKQNAIGDIIQAINNPTYTTTEGTNLSINNTRVGKMKFEYYGDTEQETTTGINLFVDIDTQELNSMKITRTNEGYILNGTTSEATTFRGTITTPVTSIKSIAVKSDKTINQGDVQIKTRASNLTQLRSINATGSTWVVDSGEQADAYCDIYIKNGVQLTNVLIQPMLVSGTYTSGTIPDYEPYTGRNSFT